jgi:hypothetical protein
LKDLGAAVCALGHIRRSNGPIPPVSALSYPATRAPHRCANRQTAFGVIDILPDVEAVDAASILTAGANMNMTLSIGPLVSLIAGILILVVPRLLNYIVAIYLIVIGLLGLFGTGNFQLK